ncbi:MAG: phospholipase D family protein [Betaproteobacteria bacterium]
MRPTFDRLTRTTHSLIATLALLLVAACATLPPAGNSVPSWAIAPDSRTLLGRALESDLSHHPDQSGLMLLDSGLDAFIARALAADMAERTLDLQYYLVHDGLTTRVLLARVLAAADRGVRVRLLVDDLHTAGKDANIAVLDGHPNIEVRVFNPFATRNWRWLAFLTDGERANHRMHNKMFVADNQLAIVGGRNLGDEYFWAADGTNFADMDLLAVGSVVPETSASFDEYWNSPWAYRISRFFEVAAGSDALDRLRYRLEKEALKAADSQYAQRLRQAELVGYLGRGELPMAWADARAVYDRPRKVTAKGRVDPAIHIGPQVRPITDSARSDLTIVSPYFIPGDAGVEYLLRARARGVRIRVLTNSLASNDVPPAHMGYARYRVALLRGGVELYEMRPALVGKGNARDSKLMIGSSSASLHTKAFVVDGEQVFVGSMNLDPRSALLNTELGLLVDSPEIARQLLGVVALQLMPRNSFRVELEPKDGPVQHLVWVGEENGAPVRLTAEPNTNWWRRTSMTILSWFIPESIL